MRTARIMYTEQATATARFAACATSTRRIRVGSDMLVAQQPAGLLAA